MLNRKNWDLVRSFTVTKKELQKYVEENFVESTSEAMIDFLEAKCKDAGEELSLEEIADRLRRVKDERRRRHLATAIGLFATSSALNLLPDKARKGFKLLAVRDNRDSPSELHSEETEFSRQLEDRLLNPDA